VLSYVEAGAGVGTVPESVISPGDALSFIPLKPLVTVPLVVVWQEDNDSPAVQRFRELLIDWKKRGELWPAKDVPMLRV
jgi:DNA-binding transcriptional LysR family regulator